MRKQYLALFFILLPGITSAHWVDAVTPESVAQAVLACEKDTTASHDNAICRKEGQESDQVTALTVTQIAVDLLFREIDRAVYAYLALFQKATSAYPVEFAHSVAACFSFDTQPNTPPMCLSRDEKTGKGFNFAQSYLIACDRAIGLVEKVANETYPQLTKKRISLTSTDAWSQILRGEENSRQTSNNISCRSLARNKVKVLRHIAENRSAEAIQRGYEDARLQFIASISEKYFNLLKDLQRMTLKLDIIDSKWKTRTKEVYQ